MKFFKYDPPDCNAEPVHSNQQITQMLWHLNRYHRQKMDSACMKECYRNTDVLSNCVGAPAGKSFAMRS